MGVGSLRVKVWGKDCAKSENEYGEPDSYSICPRGIVKSRKKRTCDQQDERFGRLPFMPFEICEEYSEIGVHSGCNQIGDERRTVSTDWLVKCPVIEQAWVGPTNATGQQKTNQRACQCDCNPQEITREYGTFREMKQQSGLEQTREDPEHATRRRPWCEQQRDEVPRIDYLRGGEFRELKQRAGKRKKGKNDDTAREDGIVDRRFPALADPGHHIARSVKSKNMVSRQRFPRLCQTTVTSVSLLDTLVRSTPAKWTLYLLA